MMSSNKYEKLGYYIESRRKGKSYMQNKKEG